MNVSRILLKKYNVPTYRSLSFIRYNACRRSGKHFQKSLNSADFSLASVNCDSSSVSADKTITETIQTILHSDRPLGKVEAYGASSLNANISPFFEQMRNDMFLGNCTYLEHIRGVIKNLHSTDKIGSSDASFLLLCCGHSLADALPPERLKLFEDLWELLPGYGVQYKVEHYSARIVVYNENGKQFSCEDMLKEMEEAGIEPSRYTFELLVHQCCKQGNIEEAMKMVELMKEKKMSLNERIFASLALFLSTDEHNPVTRVICFAFLRDEDGAKGIMDLMETKGLRPSSLTYAAKLLAYAELGDKEKIYEVLDDASAVGIFLSDDALFDVLFVLCENGHDDLSDIILERFRKMPGYFTKANNASVRLAVGDHCEIAIKVLRTIRKNPLPDGTLKSIGDKMLRYMVQNDALLSSFSFVLKSLKAEHMHSNPYEVALKYCYLYQHPDIAEGLLREMKAVGIPLRTHYFWPMLCAESVRTSAESLLRILGIMDELQVPVTLSTLTDWFYPNLPPDADVEKLLNSERLPALTPNLYRIGYMCYLLREVNAKEALELAKKHRIRMLSGSRIIDALCFAFARGEVNACMELLRILNDWFADDSAAVAFNSKILQRLSGFAELDKFEEILQCAVKQNLVFDSATLQNLREKFSNTGNEKFVEYLNTLMKYESSSVNVKNATAAVSNIDVDQFIDECNQMGAVDKFLADVMLRKAIADQKYDDFKKLYFFLKDHNDWYATVGHDQQMIHVYLVTDEVDQAVQLFKSKEMKYAHTALAIAEALVKQKRVDDALDILRENCNRTDEYENGRFAAALNSFLDSAVMDVSPEELCTLLNGTSVGNFPMNISSLITKCIKKYIDRNELDKAVEFFERAALFFRRMPYATELTIELVKKEQSALLQKAFDIVVRIRGELHAVLMLALALVSCGRVDQANQLLKRRGVRLDHNYLISFCRIRVENNKFRDLEALFTATNGVVDCNRNNLLSFLLITYRNGRNWRRALYFWNLLKEENFHLSKRNLLLFKKIFSDNGQLPPDDLIELLENSGVERMGSDMDALEQTEDDLLKSIYNVVPSSEVIALLNEKRIEEAVNLFQEVVQMRQSFPLKVSRQVIMTLRRMKDWESLSKIRRSLPASDVRMLNLQYYIGEVMINCGECERFLESLEIRPKLRTYSSLVALLLENNPKLEERVHLYAENAYRLNNPVPLVGLWMYYTVNGRDEEARALAERLGEKVIASCFKYQYLFQQAKDRNQLSQMIDSTLTMMKKHCTTESISAAVGSLILIERENSQRVEELIKMAEENGWTSSRFYKRIINGLKSSTTMNEDLPDDAELMSSDDDDDHDDIKEDFDKNKATTTTTTAETH
ncbi:Leucine-rich PPR motif-containing protein, mitochondrial [Trichinella patagoniensis]|uniref:Leucine-rich PPR motif-containing protein, mitochondrial n=1 Tax=Trichinella patagoniensis TaxID=990121 RepID=A0A0V1ABC2_9BILA|nr:Leucine-rich PPR motif-containing protein, mitochondrial [Trichinella patagoniensis]